MPGTWHIFEDGAGGIWYEVDNPSKYNRIDYEGQVIWEEAQTVYEDGTKFMHGFRGGGLFNARGHDVSYIVLLNENGELWSEDHIHDFSEVQGRDLKTPPSPVELIDDIFVLVLQGSVQEGPVRMTYSSLSFYDPIENSFPAEIAGIDVGLGFLRAITQTSDNNVLYARSWFSDTIIEKLTLNGERVEQEEIQTEGILVRKLISAPENGFWTYGTTSGVAGDDSKMLVNRYSEEGEPFNDDFSYGSISYRHTPVEPLLWEQDNIYKMTFWQSYAGLTMQTLDSDGEIVGDPEGEILMEDPDRHRFDKRYLHSIKVGNRIIIMRAYSYYLEEIRYWSVRFYGLDLEGEKLWQSQLADSSYKFVTSKLFFDLYKSSDDRHVFWFYEHNDYSEEHLYLRIACFDPVEGEIEWERQLDIRERTRVGRLKPGLVIGEDYIYIITHSINQYGITINRMDFDGNLMWEEPFDLEFDPDNSGFFGSGLNPDGDLCLGRFDVLDNGAEFHLDVLTQNQQYIEGEEPVFAEPLYLGHDQGIARSWAFDSRLITTVENTWIVPFGQTEAGIQCISEDGERLLSDQGYSMAGFPEERTEENFMVCEDKANGIWVVWNGFEGVRCQHFAWDGAPHEGWGRNGIQLWQNSSVYEFIDLYPYSNQNLIILADLSRFVGQFREWTTSSPSYSVLHVFDGELASTPTDDDLTPGYFRIIGLYPNPFNNRINIKYELKGKNPVKLHVSDITGRRVYSSAISPDKQGDNIRTIDTIEWGSGIYIISFKSERVSDTRKVVLIK